MSSCTECHGWAGEKYDDHTSDNCPLVTTPQDQTPQVEEAHNETMCGFCYYEGGGKEGLIDTSDPDWELGRGCSA